MKKLILSIALCLCAFASCDDDTSSNNSNNTNNTNNSNNTNNINNTNTNNTNNTNNINIVEPEDPGTADIRFSIDFTAASHRISPHIYGINSRYDDFPAEQTGIKFLRAGGNRWTAYNWENNASNAGSDWLYQNDGYLSDSETPAVAVTDFITQAHNNDSATLVTVPIAGYVAADKDGPTASDGGDIPTRFKISLPQKGSDFTLNPDTTDDFVYQDEFVNFIETQFPYAADDARRKIFYSLDNEPDLWSDTHSEIHPNSVTYSELLSKSIDFSTGIKSRAPSSKVFGFVSYGYNGYVNLQNAPDSDGNGDFIEYFLSGMEEASTQAGVRLLDVLDLHWYPEANYNGERITSDSAGELICEERMQAPRSLWDPTYVENSWIANDYLSGPIALIPDLKDKIANFYPGTEIAFTEYYYGAGNHICGGITQADVLGIFGRENVFAANLWRLGETDHSFIYSAFSIFGNYDGNGATFGDTSVSAQTTDSVKTSVYASVHSETPYQGVIVLINKTMNEMSAAVTIRGTMEYAACQVFTLTADSSSIQQQSNISMTVRNGLIYNMPPQSVTVIVPFPYL